jgi:hypothetical protein
MATFNDDIFSVFDESAQDEAPTTKSEERQHIEVLKFQPDVK